MQSLGFLDNCRDPLANMFFRDEVAGHVLNPRFLGGPRFFLSGLSPLAGLSQLSRWEPASCPCMTQPSFDVSRGHDEDMHASDLAGINGISQIFTATHLPARCAPLGPHTASLTTRNFVILLLNLCFKDLKFSQFLCLMYRQILYL